MIIRNISNIRWATLGTLLVALFLPGCAKRAGELFPPVDPPVVWPRQPEQSRVRYVGQLSTSEDLKPAVPFGQALGDALFGKRQVHSMLTPYSLCTDNADRLFVTDTNAQRVHVFNLKTRKYQQWSPLKPKKGFSQPIGVAWDPAGRLLVTDSVDARIYVFDNTGKDLPALGEGELVRPCGIAIDAPSNRIYVADAGAHQIVVLDLQGRLIRRIGRRGTKPGEFNFPTNVVLGRNGNLFVSDSLNYRLQEFDLDFAPVRQIGTKGDLPGYFGHPKGIAVDSDQHLYVVDAQFEAVQIFDPNGALLLNFGQEGRGPGQFWLPAGVWIDAHNRIWVADTYNRRVQVFDYLPEDHP